MVEASASRVVERLEQADGDAVHFFARRAARNPDADRGAFRLAVASSRKTCCSSASKASGSRKNAVTWMSMSLAIARTSAESWRSASAYSLSEAASPQRHAPLDPPLDRGALVAAEVDARLRPDDRRARSRGPCLVVDAVARSISATLGERRPGDVGVPAQAHRSPSCASLGRSREIDDAGAPARSPACCETAPTPATERGDPPSALMARSPSVPSAPDPEQHDADRLATPIAGQRTEERIDWQVKPAGHSARPSVRTPPWMLRFAPDGIT